MRVLVPVAGVLATILSACSVGGSKKTMGRVELFDSSLLAIIDTSATAEILGEGYAWSEGPLWVEQHQMLLFSDIPNNEVLKWTESGGVKTYLKPSGFTGTDFKGKEPGSNGLLLNRTGQLVLCQHGDRRLAVMEGPLDKPSARFRTVVDAYAGKRLNSPNDAVYDSEGNLYFTDPPYGLPGNVHDPGKEIPFQGVYKLRNDGQLILLIDSMPRPNGIGLSPDEKTLYVANSEGPGAHWNAFDIQGDSLHGARTFFSVAWKEGEKGAPDGLKVDRQGNVFATGPGGVWILNPDGKALGRIRLPEATANCALSTDGKWLFMTSDMYLLRIALR